MKTFCNFCKYTKCKFANTYQCFKFPKFKVDRTVATFVSFLDLKYPHGFNISITVERFHELETIIATEDIC